MRPRTGFLFGVLSLVLCGVTTAWVQEALDAPIANVVEFRPGPATAANAQRAVYLQSLFVSASARNGRRVTRSDGALNYVTNLWSSWPSYRVLHAAIAELGFRQSIGLECSGTGGENFRSTWIVEGHDGRYYIFAASSQSFSFRKYDDGDKTFTTAMAVAKKIVHSGTGTGVENQIDGTCSAVTLVKDGRRWTKLSYGYENENLASWEELRRVLFAVRMEKSGE
jgi:hypothetical protein